MRDGLRLRFALAAVVIVAVVWGGSAGAVEYQINFTDGTELRTSRVRQVGEAIHYEKFGGEASVAVGEVASVYVIENDGEVSWVMQPRREGDALPANKGRVALPSPAPKPPPATVTPPVARPPQKRPASPPDEAKGSVAVSEPEPVPPAATASAPVKPVSELPQGNARETAASSAAPPIETPRPGKVILDPPEPLPQLLLRLGGAPIAALLALLAAVFVFRKKFRAGEQGIPATEPLAATTQREVDFSVPSKSWETLVAAIEERDFEVYRLCWKQNYPDEDLDLTFQKSLMNWKYYDYSVVKTEPHPKSKDRFYLHIKRSTKFDRKDLEERMKRVSLVLTDGGWKFEEVPYGF